MATLATVRARVTNLVSNSSMIDSSTLTSIIQADHQTILNDYSWSRRKKDTIINTVAPYTTGTITTSGNTSIIGSSTVWTSSMVGRWLRPGTTSNVSGNTYFFKISAFTDATHITIESPGVPTNISTWVQYTIFQHVYLLPSDWGRVLNVTSDTRLEEWSRSMIDRVDPYRSSTANRPDMFSIRGLDSPGTSSAVFQIEFWPVPQTAQAMRVEYLIANDLVNDSDEPLYRSDILVWKSAESAAFYLHAKTGDLAWLALADRYHQRYTEALEGAREDDLGKSSVPLYVRDRAWNYSRGDDFFIDKDSLWLR